MSIESIRLEQGQLMDLLHLHEAPQLASPINHQPTTFSHRVTWKESQTGLQERSHAEFPRAPGVQLDLRWINGLGDCDEEPAKVRLWEGQSPPFSVHHVSWGLHLEDRGDIFAVESPNLRTASPDFPKAAVVLRNTSLSSLREREKIEDPSGWRAADFKRDATEVVNAVLLILPGRRPCWALPSFFISPSRQLAILRTDSWFLGHSMLVKIPESRSLFQVLGWIRPVTRACAWQT
ncbi:hypothetical protein ACJZ2D_003863 [Fusarium nematophilum]